MGSFPFSWKSRLTLERGSRPDRGSRVRARDDAQEFVEWALIYGEANPKPLRPAWEVATTIELSVRTEGSFDVTLSEEGKGEASAVLAEWVHSGDEPEAARTLHRVLAASYSSSKSSLPCSTSA
jgi:hypothetical protein